MHGLVLEDSFTLDSQSCVPVITIVAASRVPVNGSPTKAWDAAIAGWPPVCSVGDARPKHIVTECHVAPTA
uniref:DUF982 domain-containing protein n=1 Tax=Steinernema glaseri TaxID=37863 RepID=A0A1I8ANJ2_9BILA